MRHRIRRREEAAKRELELSLTPQNKSRPDLVEWRYEIGTKKHPAHAFTIYSEGSNDAPLCGTTLVPRKYTRKVDAVTQRRKYPVYRCYRCNDLATKLGIKPARF